MDLVQAALNTPNQVTIKQKPGHLEYRWDLPLRPLDGGDHYHSFCVGDIEIIEAGAGGNGEPNSLPTNPWILHRGDLDQRGGMVAVGGHFVFDKIQPPNLILAKLDQKSGVVPVGIVDFCATFVSNDGLETTPCPFASVIVTNNAVAGQVFLNLPGWNLLEGVNSRRLYVRFQGDPKFYLFDESIINNSTYQFNLTPQDVIGKPQPPSYNQTGQFWHKGDTFSTFGVQPVTQQIGGPLVAGNQYTANEERMLNVLWQMAQKYGFLT